jgi:hypothetical protein
MWDPDPRKIVGFEKVLFTESEKVLFTGGFQIRICIR